jgi:hypothetical protein
MLFDLLITTVTFLFVINTNTLADSGDFRFETDTVRYMISPAGISKSLAEKKTGHEFLKSNEIPFAAIKKQGKIFTSSHVRRNGDLLRVEFGQSGVQADFKITGRPDCIVFQLVHLHGDGVEEARLTQLRLAPLENAGHLLTARWNERFTVYLAGLSDRVETRLGENELIQASVYPEFGMEGESVAIIAVPTPQFLTTVQAVERTFRIPSSILGSQWAKRSTDIRESYLFTDLTEANVDETIRYAKLAGFKYILIYSGTWASTLGSYPINNRSFPGGEKGLKAVIDKCHAAGLKVGMHMLTSFVGKNDSLVHPVPDPGLLKDAEAILALELDEKAQEIAATTGLADFPAEQAYYGTAKAGLDLVIDDEIIHYQAISDHGSTRFLKCSRGYAGTKAMLHKAGAKITHLAERYGSYLADLRTPLKDKISDRVAGLINRCGFDMIYFDGGEVNSANGPAWYWVGQQQIAIWQRVKRDLLVQGSGMTPWTWHFFGRGTSDDFAAVATKQYLDYHKIPDSWQSYTKSFMPAELGWWGFLAAAPDHPATTPDEVEYYAVRMLALDAPVSLETNLQALKENGRTDEMLKLLDEFEKMRLRSVVPFVVRERLRTGEWHMVMRGGKPEFHPIRYDMKRIDSPGEVKVNNDHGSQKFKFRLQAVPRLANVGNRANIALLRPATPMMLKPASPKAPMPGALAERIEFTKPVGEQTSVFMVGPGGESGLVKRGKALDLTSHRALAVRVKVDGSPPKQGEPCAVLNVQLETGSKTYRDHYIDLDFSGERTIIISEPNTERMLPEFRPAPGNYAFKAAMYDFDYKNIVALNLRWMRHPLGKPVQCSIVLVEALTEVDTVLKNPEISIGTAKFTLPVSLKNGDYAEYLDESPVRVFDRNGVLLSTVKSLTKLPELPSGESLVRLNGGVGAAKLTTITLGEAIK